MVISVEVRASSARHEPFQQRCTSVSRDTRRERSGWQPDRLLLRLHMHAAPYLNCDPRHGVELSGFVVVDVAGACLQSVDRGGIEEDRRETLVANNREPHVNALHPSRTKIARSCMLQSKGDGTNHAEGGVLLYGNNAGQMHTPPFALPPT